MGPRIGWIQYNAAGIQLAVQLLRKEMAAYSLG